MTVFQLFASVVGGLILYLIVRSFNERYAVFVSIAGTIALLLFVASELTPIFNFIKKLGGKAGENNKYFSTVIKGLAICYLSEFTAGFCKDCGQSGWAEKVEMACRCALLVLTIPLFEEFLDVIGRLLE